jgi:hypothetical protein
VHRQFLKVSFAMRVGHGGALSRLNVLEAKIAAREEKLGIRPRRETFVQQDDPVPSASETKSNILAKRIEARKFAIEESRAQVLQKFGPRQKLISKAPQLGHRRDIIRRPLPALDPNVNPFAKKPQKIGGLSSVEKNIENDIIRLKKESEQKLLAKKARKQKHRDEVVSRQKQSNLARLAPIQAKIEKGKTQNNDSDVTLGPQQLRMPGMREMIAEAEGKVVKKGGRKGSIKENKNTKKKVRGDTPEEDSSDSEDEFDVRLAKATGEAPRYRGTWHCLDLGDTAALTPVMQRSHFSRQLKATAVVTSEVVDKVVSKEEIVEGAVDKYARKHKQILAKRERLHKRERGGKREGGGVRVGVLNDPRGLWDENGYKIGTEGCTDGETSAPDVVVQVGKSAYNVEPAVEHQRNTATRLAMPKSQEQLEGAKGANTRKASRVKTSEKHTSLLTKDEIEAEKKYQRKRRMSHLASRTDRQRRQLEDLMGKHGLEC